MRSLESLVTVVTGASNGIGSAIARLFAAEKARLVLSGRNQERLNDVAASTGLSEDRFALVVGDIRQAETMQRIVATAQERFGRIDIFVNNAGVGIQKLVYETTEAEFDEMLETNLKAVFRSFHAVIPVMLAQGEGQIVNISSGAARIGAPGMAVYAASKAALNILSESAAGEVRNENIKISVLSPASTDTNFGSNMAGQPATTVSRAARKLAVDEVAEAVLFLAKQNSNAWTSMVDIRPLKVKI